MEVEREEIKTKVEKEKTREGRDGENSERGEVGEEKGLENIALQEKKGEQSWSGKETPPQGIRGPPRTSASLSLSHNLAVRAV